MEFDELLTQAIALLQRQGRVSYGALKHRFKLDDDYLEDLRVELIEAHGLAADEQGRILIWLSSPSAAPLSTAPSVRDTAEAPLACTLPYLTERILASRATLEDERKQVTVLFADLNGWLVLQAGSVSYRQATVEARYGAAMPLADELGMRPLEAHCHCGLGTLYATTGQREHARAELSIAIELYRTMEMSFWLPQAEAALARVEGR